MQPCNPDALCTCTPPLLTAASRPEGERPRVTGLPCLPYLPASGQVRLRLRLRLRLRVGLPCFLYLPVAADCDRLDTAGGARTVGGTRQPHRRRCGCLCALCERQAAELGGGAGMCTTCTCTCTCTTTLHVHMHVRCILLQTHCRHSTTGLHRRIGASRTTAYALHIHCTHTGACTLDANTTCTRICACARASASASAYASASASVCACTCTGRRLSLRRHSAAASTRCMVSDG